MTASGDLCVWNRIADCAHTNTHTREYDDLKRMHGWLYFTYWEGLPGLQTDVTVVGQVFHWSWAPSTSALKTCFYTSVLWRAS